MNRISFWTPDRVVAYRPAAFEGNDWGKIEGIGARVRRCRCKRNLSDVNGPAKGTLGVNLLVNP
jgi:hypothetical protein